MADEGQISAIIATVICDCQKGSSDRQIDPEAARIIAKCIIASLEDAGFKIRPPA